MGIHVGVRVASSTCVFTLDSTPAELLASAIQHEATSRLFLTRIAARLPGAPDRDVIEALAERKLDHQREFERKYTEQFGTPPPSPSEEEIQMPPEGQILDLARVLKMALERERDIESHWRFLAERVPETREATLLLEMAEIQWRHRNEVQQLYDQAAASDPDRFFEDM